jgi:hypothetical protein
MFAEIVLLFLIVGAGALLSNRTIAHAADYTAPLTRSTI